MSLDELAKKIGFEVSKVQDAGERWEKAHLETPLPAELVRGLMEQAIDTLLKGGVDEQDSQKDRLVIIIDDLDRCQGHVAFRLLEAIKVYLSTKNCVFVLGLDWQNTRKAVAAELLRQGLIHVGGNEANEKRSSMIEATEYLSKLCQHVYPLPTMTDPREYLSSLFKDPVNSEPYEVFRRDAFHVNVTKPSGELDERWLDILCEPGLLPNNPRRIKNFVNGLALYLRNLRKVFHDSVQPKVHLEFSHKHAAIVAVLRYEEIEMFRILQSNPDFWSELLKWSHGGESNAEVFVGRTLALGDEGLNSNKQGVPFPDPADARLFRLGSLLRKHFPGKTLDAGMVFNAISSDEFRMYVQLEPLEKPSQTDSENGEEADS